VEELFRNASVLNNSWKVADLILLSGNLILAYDLWI
jgi:hypothetical protein